MSLGLLQAHGSQSRCARATLARIADPFERVVARVVNIIRSTAALVAHAACAASVHAPTGESHETGGCGHRTAQNMPACTSTHVGELFILSFATDKLLLASGPLNLKCELVSDFARLEELSEDWEAL